MNWYGEYMKAAEDRDELQGLLEYEEAAHERDVEGMRECIQALLDCPTAPREVPEMVEMAGRWGCE